MEDITSEKQAKNSLPINIELGRIEKEIQKQSDYISDLEDRLMEIVIQNPPALTEETKPEAYSMFALRLEKYADVMAKNNERILQLIEGLQL